MPSDMSFGQVWRDNLPKTGWGRFQTTTKGARDAFFPGVPDDGFIFDLKRLIDDSAMEERAWRNYSARVEGYLQRVERGEGEAARLMAEKLLSREYHWPDDEEARSRYLDDLANRRIEIRPGDEDVQRLVDWGEAVVQEALEVDEDEPMEDDEGWSGNDDNWIEDPPADEEGGDEDGGADEDDNDAKEWMGGDANFASKPEDWFLVTDPVARSLDWMTSDGNWGSSKNP